MGLELRANQLLSRVIRWNASNGRSGSGIINGGGSDAVLAPQARRLNFLARFQTQTDESGGILGRLWNAAKGLVGFIGQIVGIVAFSVSEIFGWLVGIIEQVKAFDWNLSDKQLKQSLQSQNVALASAWGAAVGQGIGWIAGIGIGGGIGFYCPVIGSAALAKVIAGAVTEEALEEILEATKNALSETAKAIGRTALINGYIQFRHFLKAAPRDLLKTAFGEDAANFIKNQWGAEGGPDLSFNTRMDDAVEKIGNDAIQAFVEELLEESWDSFTEAGFIIAKELDEAFTHAKLATNKIDGPERTVEIQPDKRLEEETLTFQAVPQRQLAPLIETTLNQHRLIYNRDVGLFVGQPLEEFAKAKPQTLRVIIDMYSVRQPPFFKTVDDDFVWSTVTIPDVKRTALDWEKIKRAAGGNNGYMWGRFRAMAYLDNGRKLVCYGNSEGEAEERVKALLELTNAHMDTLNIVEEKKEADRIRYPKLTKNATRIYPGNFTIINRKEILDNDRGHPSRQGNYRDAKVKIPLWTDRKPKNFDEMVDSVIRTGF